MLFLPHRKLLVLLLFYISIFASAFASETGFTLPCKEKDLTIIITGTKTKESKLKKFLFSELKRFAEMTEAEAITHIQKIFQDTGLFESVRTDQALDGSVTVAIKDTYTLLPIINFSTNLESFSYTVGASESNLFNDAWQIAGAWSQSSSSKNLFYSLNIINPIQSVQSIGLGGSQGDSYTYYLKKWYQFETEDYYLTFRFKDFANSIKVNYGAQLRYTQLSFLDKPTLSTSAFVSFGESYRNHDISEGYSLGLNARYIENTYNRYTFSTSFQKNWYLPIKSNSVFRGLQINYQADYSLIEEPRNSVGVIFSYRSGALHGIRSNSVYEKHFGTTGVRLGVTSQKFLWTYWQPHIFMETGLSENEKYYSVGGGLLLTFPALYNSRLRIQYYIGEIPDKLSGIIISTSIDF